MACANNGLHFKIIANAELALTLLVMKFRLWNSLSLAPHGFAEMHNKLERPIACDAYANLIEFDLHRRTEVLPAGL